MNGDIQIGIRLRGSFKLLFFKQTKLLQILFMFYLKRSLNYTPNVILKYKFRILLNIQYIVWTPFPENSTSIIQFKIWGIDNSSKPPKKRFF